MKIKNEEAIEKKKLKLQKYIIHIKRREDERERKIRKKKEKNIKFLLHFFFIYN
jgi:hypothetical protein